MSRRTAIYVRISSDPTGQGLGVARQRTACTSRAQALGWDVVEVYEDNDVSATSGRLRPAYQRMLSDLEAGRVDAVVVWDLDRLHRQRSCARSRGHDPRVAQQSPQPSATEGLANPPS